MTAANIATAERACIDHYPSRRGSPAHLLERLEPVVYSQDLSNAPVSPGVIKQYEEQGFFVLEDVFSDAQLKCLQREQQRLQAAPPNPGDATRIHEPGDNTLRSIFAVHASNELFSQLARDPRLLDLARFLLDDEVYVHQSRLNYKPGFRGKEFYWHSDFETWHVEDGMPRMRALSMSIALTDNSSNNGPLMLLPGSHKQFVVCSGSTPKNHFRESLRKQEYGVPPDHILEQIIQDSGIVTVAAKPGSVLVFDCNTLHGSNSNITPFPRANAFIVYNAISNRVGEPFCSRPPRPEYVCSRRFISPLKMGEGLSGDE